MRSAFLLFISLAFFVNSSQAQKTPEDAELVMKKAYREASAYGKKVILIFHASWCVWCHRMDSSLNDISCKKFIDDNFVVQHVTVQESKGNENLQNPGGEALMNKFNGKDQGLPYWVILDAGGKLLFDSQVRTKQADGTLKGSNMGCPASEGEVNAFIEMLRKTTKLDETALTAIRKRFRMNEH